jgi:2-C-methyl-D-erythritol 2,4-cyclodiphosphate synthase
MMRIGHGFDVHAFGDGDHVMLGGVRVAHTRGVLAHSDGDVVLHALCDAILGACALGDIGQHFPPGDPQWKDADSRAFVRQCAALVRERGWVVGNADVTVICERPKVGPHADAMRALIAEDLGVAIDAISVKATTTETLGFTGRGEGIAAQAVCLLVRAGARTVRRCCVRACARRPKISASTNSTPSKRAGRANTCCSRSKSAA